MEVPKAKERIPLSTHSQAILGTAAPRSPRSLTVASGGVGSDDLAALQLKRQQHFPTEIRIRPEMVEPYETTVGEKQAKTDEARAACLMVKQGKHGTLLPSEEDF